MTLRNLIGKRVKKWRKRKNLTQEDLAFKINKSVESISLIERSINIPTIETIEDISKILDVPVHEFYRDSNQKTDIQEIIDNIVGVLHKMDKRELKIIEKQIEALIEEDK